MATKRDLVEAHDFNRRRLVTAFLSGAPGGREVEPVRHGRTIVGGLVLAGLLVAGAAVLGVLKPAVDDGWKDDGLVIAEGTGSRYLMFDGTLYPIANITSARLILEDLKISYVPEETLSGTPRGTSIGIVNAPDFLPARSDLLQTGWVACTNAEGGLRLTLRPDARAAEARQTLLVRSSTDKKYSVISGDRRYPIATGKTSTDILRTLQLDRAEPFGASNTWLGLFTTGSAIEPFTVPGSGSKVDEVVDGLDTVGTPVQADGRGYVLGRDGLVPLTPFAYAVYRGSPAGSRFTEQTFEANELNGLRTVPDDRIVPADWPEQLTSASTDTRPCALLQRGAGGSVNVAVLARAEASGLRPSSTDTSVDVGQGVGAVVTGTSRVTANESDTTFLVDSLGTRYAVVPRRIATETLARIGYRGVEPAGVPRTWLDLLREGPDLGAELAGRSIG